MGEATSQQSCELIPVPLGDGESRAGQQVCLHKGVWKSKCKRKPLQKGNAFNNQLAFVKSCEIVSVSLRGVWWLPAGPEQLTWKGQD